jgi:tyrosyl-tRNA synthetase
MMIKYYELLSYISNEELTELKIELDKGLNPIIAKKRLALEIVERYHDKLLADKAVKYFEEKFQKRINPEEIETLSLGQDFCEKYTETSKEGIIVQILPLISAVSAAESNSEAKRLIKQGAVKVDLIDNTGKDAVQGADKSAAGVGNGMAVNEIRIDDGFVVLPLESDEFVLKVGKKKVFRIKLNLQTS